MKKEYRKIKRISKKVIPKHQYKKAKNDVSVILAQNPLIHLNQIQN